jgi:hypothetical protein
VKTIAMVIFGDENVAMATVMMPCSEDDCHGDLRRSECGDGDGDDAM